MNSEQPLSKKELEERGINSKDLEISEEELVKEKKKIEEMPEEKEEKTVEERTIEKLSEKYPKVPKDLLKNYVEATKKLGEMNIPTKLKEEENLTLKEKLALQDWKNIKATMDLLGGSK